MRCDDCENALTCDMPIDADEEHLCPLFTPYRDATGEEEELPDWYELSENVKEDFGADNVMPHHQEDWD